MDALQVFPLELWIQIAEFGTPKVWMNLCCTVTLLGRYSLDPRVQLKMMNKFASEKCYLPNGIKHSYRDRPVQEYGSDGTLRCEIWCKNGKRHRGGDQPAGKWYHKGGTLCDEE